MSKEKPKPGPDADRLALDGNWQDRVGQALKKKRPKDGWPKPEKKSKKKAPKN